MTWNDHFSELYEKYRQDQDIHRKLTHIMAAIDDLKAQADATVAIIKQLVDIIAQPSNDAQVTAITAELKTATDAAQSALPQPVPAPVEPPPAA